MNRLLLNQFLFVLICVCFSSTQGIAQSPDSNSKTRLQAWEQHRQMEADSPYRSLTWQAMGPKFAGGRIESIDAPRGSLNTLYVGVGAGGVWKTTDGGLTWKHVFQKESTFAIGDVAIDPSDSNTIWVGTGECHVGRSSYSGTGVFKSTDGGESWANMGLHESAHVGSVLIDPKNSDVVFVAAMGRRDGSGEQGVYKTTDGGLSFRQVLSAGERVSVVDLVFDPHDSNRMFASAWDRHKGEQSGVFRSDDCGETWKRLKGGLLEQQVDRVAVDVSASQAGVVYALMADRSSPDLERRRNASILFRSEDYGETWKRTHEGYVPTYVGWDFCDVRVAPDDVDRVYIGGTRLIFSTDGGKTFQGEGGFAVNKKVDEVFRLHPHRGIGVHLDVHDIWIDPVHPERVILGNDGGLFMSWNRGLTWLHLNNLPIAEFYKIHLDDQTPFQIWGGTQDNASFVGPATARFQAGGDDDWQHVFLDPWTGGDGFATFPDPNDPTITYYTQQNGDLKRSRMGNLAALKSIRPRALTGETELRFAWDTSFFFSRHTDKTVLYCAAQRVMKSMDRGNSWESFSPDLTANGLLVLAESPTDSNRLAAGGERGEVHLTSDGGKSWVSAGNGLPHRAVRDIQLSGHDPERVFVALSGRIDNEFDSHVYLSDDFGKTWQSISSSLPHEPVNTIVEDPKNENLLFVGTDLGVYVSIDRGTKWSSLCSTLPTAPVVDLALHDRDSILVAATHGLSLFSLDVKSIREQSKKDD